MLEHILLFSNSKTQKGEKCHEIIISVLYFKHLMSILFTIGVRAGGTRGAAAPPNFGQLNFLEERGKIWAKPLFKDISILFNYFKDLNINLK